MEKNFQFISAAVSDRGLSEKRPQNEDSFLESNQLGLFAVADGVGGAQAGEVASQMAVEILSEAFFNIRQTSDAEDVMKLGIERANHAIFQTSQELPKLASMATTIVALHLAGNIATIGHVGDSRLYRLDENGNLFRETQDHSVVEEEVRAGRMTEEQAANHPSKNIISRALGADSVVEIDMKTIMVEPNNSFLLCSDGITRHINDLEIRDLLNADARPDEICRKMKNLCYERGAEDNLTAVIIKVIAENADVDRPIAAAEDDETTVTGTRPPLVNTAIFSQKRQFDDEIPTQNLNAADLNREQSFAAASADSGNSPEPVQNVSQYNSPGYSVEQPESAETDYADRTVPVHGNSAAPPITESGFRVDTGDDRHNSDNAGSGAVSKFLGSVLLLIAGAILGAGAYYFFMQNAAPQTAPPSITQMQSPEIAYTAFENNRRNVDSNPQQFIAANVAAPQDAEDFYLLGRAYLLTGKYGEAKQAFNEAKNKLAQADASNAKTLATEIAMALAIVNNPLAQEVFTKDVSAAPTPSTNTNSAANR